MIPKDKRLRRMLRRALWLKRCVMNPELFKTFDMNNEESVLTMEEQESIVSMLLSDPVLASDSW